MASVDQPESTPTVAVIGAGIAGLAAASELRRLGCQVVVLEARSRVGGRIHSVPVLNGGSAGAATSAVVDLGAAWVHGFCDEHPLTPALRSLGMDGMTTDWDESCAWADQVNSCQMDGEEFGALWEDYEYTIRRAKQERGRLRTQPPPQGNADAADHPPHRRVADMSVHAASLTAVEAVLGKGRWAAEHVAFCYKFELGGDYGVSADSLSCLYYDEDSAFDGPDVLPNGGLGKLIDYLAEGLDIRLSCEVTQVDYARAGTDTPRVCLRYRSPSGEVAELMADAAITTLPLGVLKSRSVQFDPPLPPAVSDAITHLGFGVVNKVVVAFDNPFWAEWDCLREACANAHAFVRVGAPNGFNFFLNPCGHDGGADIRPAVLVGFLVCDAATKLDGLSDEEAKTFALAELKDTLICLGMPPATELPAPVNVVITRWGADPFSRGSYSSLPPGAVPEMFESLAKPLPFDCDTPTLFPAGEATSRKYHSTAHGAYLSGLDAASRACNSLRKRFAYAGMVSPSGDVRSSATSSANGGTSSADVAQLVAMGFGTIQAQHALQAANGNLDRAAAILLDG